MKRTLERGNIYSRPLLKHRKRAREKEYNPEAPMALVEVSATGPCCQGGVAADVKVPGVVDVLRIRPANLQSLDDAPAVQARIDEMVSGFCPRV